MYDLTIFESCLDIIVVPLCFLIWEFDLLIIPCLFPAWGIFILPEEVNLNLFFAELFVLSLGINVFWTYTDNSESLQDDIIRIKWAGLSLSFAFPQILDGFRDLDVDNDVVFGLGLQIMKIKVDGLSLRFPFRPESTSFESDI